MSPFVYDEIKFCNICNAEMWASSWRFTSCWKCREEIEAPPSLPYSEPKEPREKSFSSGLALLRRVVSARQWVLPYCESPIEAVLGAWLLVAMQDLTVAPFQPYVCLASDARLRPATDVLLIPQCPWRRYRVDFAIRVPTRPRRILFVECDGEDWHSTERQITHDRIRDEEMKVAGYPVFRFTGTEINRYPYACALSILEGEIAALASFVPIGEWPPDHDERQAS